MSEEKEIKERVGGLEPASSIVDRLGGPKEVADELKLHRTRVSKWKLPKATGGTGGRIPARHIDPLMRFARRKGIELRHAEFFESPEPVLDIDWFDSENGKRLSAIGFKVCACVEIAQDESCPIGFPSLLCEVCDGKGIVPEVEP